MELNDAERYAAVALFTLALHATALETGVDDAGRVLADHPVAWGMPSDAFLDEVRD